MKYNEFENDIQLEAYLSRWDREVTKPLLEWHKVLSEAKLSPDQINALFGGVETKMAGERTVVGKVATATAKGAKIAAKALPGNIASKLHGLIKDTKPVKNFDAAFENAKSKLVARLGGDDSKIVQYTNQYAAWAKKHPVLQGAIIGLLTTAAAVATGGVGAGIVGAVLKTGNELLKGETLSGSLMKGAGAGIVGAIAGMGIKELSHLIGDPMIKNMYIKQTAADPGINLSSSRTSVEILMNDSSGKSIVKKMYLDVMGTPEELEKINGTIEKVQAALDNGDTATASKLMDTLDPLQAFPKEVQAIIDDVSDDGKEQFTNWVRTFTGKELENQMQASQAVMQVATDFEEKVRLIQKGLEAAARGAGTAAGTVGEPKKQQAAESIRITEADVKGIAGSIANWAKGKAGSAVKQATQKVTAEKLTRAWKAAGSPTDSNALYSVLKDADVPEEVLKSAYKDNNIPMPRKPGTPKAKKAPKQVTVSTGDSAFDKTVNDMIAAKGKDAAIAYLQDLKKKATVATPAKTADQPITVGKEKIMPNDPRYPALKKALAQKQAGSVQPAAQPATSAAAPAASGASDFKAKQQAFQKRAAAAKASKARPVKESWTMLTEAKARIDHPEDLVIDEGAAGAKRALDAMVSLANNPRSVTIKFDGSPALIFGWDEQGFVLTDKSGFGAKGYDGMARSPEAVEAMLRGDTGRRIKDTNPEALKVRDAYARGIAGLYGMLKSLVPKTLKGYIQGDLLWHGKPELVDGNYRFGPLKISYRIPADSDLGKEIGASKAGMVIHSLFDSREDQEPRAIDDLSSLKLNKVPGLVVVPHEMRITDKLNVPADAVKKLDQAITKSSSAISGLFDDSIKSLPTLMKSYLSWKAGKGSSDYSNSPTEFIEWLESPASKATGSMQAKVKEHVSNNQAGYNAVWQLISSLTALKLHIKKQLDSAAAGNISAEFSGKAHPELVGKPGHEGFVADTEHGKIKLVNRSQFMRKNESGEEAPLNEYASGGASAAGGVASIANPFGFTVSRTPNLFGYVPAAPKKKKHKRKTSKSR